MGRISRWKSTGGALGRFDLRRAKPGHHEQGDARPTGQESEHSQAVAPSRKPSNHYRLKHPAFGRMFTDYPWGAAAAISGATFPNRRKFSSKRWASSRAARS